MAALAIEISDDEALSDSLGAVAAAVTAQPKLPPDEFLVGCIGGAASSDEQLAFFLQHEQSFSLARSPSGPRNAFSVATGGACISDEALAFQLQYQEDHARSLQHVDCAHQNIAPKKRRVTDCEDDDICVIADGQTAPRVQTDIAVQRIPEIPFCSDAVALLHTSFSKAGDVARSEIYLCGPTPFFFQSRGGTRRSHSTAAASMPSLGAMPRDNWSCGYRNIQMLIGHLLSRPNGKGGWPGLFGGMVPNVMSLQAELQALWASGYDPEGRQHFGGSVLGTKRWIGTSEACVLLRGQSVRCNIVAFRSGTAEAVPGLDCLNAASAVMERCIRHFADGVDTAMQNVLHGRCGVVMSSQPPLYLQHDGHSRTVVGVQRRHESNGACSDFLLVLDPGLGQQGFEDFMSASSRGHGWEKFVKRSSAPLKRKAEYELLIVNPYGAILPEQQPAAKRITQHI